MHAKVTDFRSHQVVLRVDFDLLDDTGRLRVSTRFLQKGPEPPERGDVVYLMDGRGRGCTAVVEEIDGWYLCVRPDWSTWVGGPRPAGVSGS